ncbi:MAG: hypothetical protein REI95_14000 [Oxalicibacterium faecigallinarum]|uniref:hypothetical protein n=1 Tax=Oxalicibacterium faecigallinarum TaxID=573741 RepID=UPI00280A428C|nr:hypothetical protein [Oxalicibacterium faecigallinarum]MDQ7970742.1 hypothetical protein [Oxalicibacterium faecigallinarum]
MNKLYTYTSLVLALFALAACDSKSPASTPPAADAASSSNSITPAPSTLPDAVPGSGPADGGTAIGGVSSTHQDDEGASKSDSPASTGGDGNGPTPSK